MEGEGVHHFVVHQQVVVEGEGVRHFVVLAEGVHHFVVRQQAMVVEGVHLVEVAGVA